MKGGKGEKATITNYCQGEKGESGISGYFRLGRNSTTVQKGQRGIQGEKGFSGDDGFHGRSGSAGTQGFKGPKGYKGKIKKELIFK